MLALFAFIFGLFVLFKGGFRLGNRTVTQAQSRPIAFYLMAPLILLFCASTLLLPNYIQFNNDGTFVISADAFEAVSNTIGTIELISVGIGIMLVIFSIYGTQRADGTPRPQPSRTYPAPQTPQPPPMPAQVPNIMTVAEASAYMRVTESDVLNLIDQGKLGAARIGDTYRIARIAIEDFMGRT